MKIEKYLLLNKYFLSLLGAKDFLDIAVKMKDSEWDLDSEGRSYFCNILRSSSKIKIPEEKIILYDGNIQAVIKKINEKREPKFSPKYFQYLALFFTEIFLDNLKNRKKDFLNELNQFLKEYKKEKEISFIEPFKEEDLQKLAFWMATGSGKTLIMHANYYQFLNYKIFSPDNLLLITPNEGLSKQHKEELEKSGIRARLYAESGGIFSKRENEILVIEITKFVEEKRGGGVTLPVNAFEGKNLLFVDEGHKGKKSEEQKWAKIRKELAKEGFVFEYSATFGQILSEKNKAILEEYAKSIIFDYSYKYFYLDGYGKDFSILNVKEPKFSTKKFQEIMFVANLLSFYEQLLVFEKYQDLVKEHNLEKPLWIFVGTTVIKGKANLSEEKELISDVLQIVEFFKKTIEDKKWFLGLCQQILEGQSGLKNEKEEDVFKDKFQILRESKVNLESLYEKVFNGKGKLRIFEIKNAEGELGLKLGENNYFGVINIGSVSEFKKQIEEKLKISVEQDVISASLFDDIKKENSSINVLIGSKKFIEGWDTWRVTSMGLLNIGKGQGPQIIQLFGRGVRLKGKNISLKRSNIKEIKPLETLNIYGIKSDYLTKFLEAIRKEDVEFETVEIPVIPQHKEKWTKLFIPVKEEKRFFEEELLKLEPDETIKVEIDLTPKIVSQATKERELNELKERELKVEKTKLDLMELNVFDWQKIFCELLEYKIFKKYFNLVFSIEDLKQLLRKANLNIFGPKIISNYGIKEREEFLIFALKKYIENFYKKKAKTFESKNMKLVSLEQTNLPLLREGKYVLQIKKRDQELIEKIKKLKEDLKKLLEEENESLPRIYFDSHLFLPILLQSKKIDKISPEGLTKSEAEFVRGLRDYLKQNKEKFKDFELYLLRNFPASGIGFQLKWSGFYPDFILWLKRGEKELIVFIDPHGLVYSRGLDDEKIVFREDLKKIEEKLQEKDIALDSFIISSTNYKNLIKGMKNPPSKKDYKEKNVLFLEDQSWPQEFFKLLTNRYFETEIKKF